MPAIPPPSHPVKQALPIIFLALFFGLLFGDLLVSHMIYRKPDGLYSGGSTWGDLAWHLSMLSNFAERGLAAVRENPIFPGVKLSYPFLPDLLSAGLVRLGFSLQSSLVLPTLAAVLGAVLALYFLARSMTGSTFAAVIVPFLYFFNGSIVGCYYLWIDYRSSHLDLHIFLNHLPKNYVYIVERNLYFSNVVSDYVLPQRASVFGLLLGILVIRFFWSYWEHSRKRHLFYAGLLLSFMPLVHIHSFVALTIAAGLLFLVQVFVEHGNWRSILLGWLLFAIPLLAIALPQTLWISPAHTGNFFRVQLGWMKGNESVWLFWLKNLSPHLFIFALAYYCAARNLKIFYLAFLGVFLLTNIVIFQPHDYDNMKLMLWWFLVSCVLTGALLEQLRRRYGRPGILLALLVVLTLTAAGAAAVYREMRLSWRMFSSEDLALADFVRNHTSKDAIFLTSDKHNNPIASLAGRRIMMGYRGWLWTHGIDYEARQQDIFEIYRGGASAQDLIRRYGVGYVLLERNKAQEFHENAAFFVTRFPIVYRDENYSMFKVSE